MKFKKILESLDQYEQYMLVHELVHREYINLFKKYRKLIKLKSPQTIKDTNGRHIYVSYDHMSFRCYGTDYREHRVGGPSNVDTKRLEAVWKQNGKLHREDGPAVISRFSGFHYYINGIEKSKEEYLKHFDIRSES